MVMHKFQTHIELKLLIKIAFLFSSLIEVGHGAQDRYDFPISVARTNLNWLSPEILAQVYEILLQIYINKS